MGNHNVKIRHSTSTHTRRVIAYIVLGLLSVLCLFWFYILLIYSTRSNGEIASGISFLPSTHFLDNFKNLLTKSTQPIFKGLRNSLIVAASSALLCTYFSTLTAYAIHVYDFKMKNFIFTFILMIMMVPTQVTVLGFIKLMGKMNLINTFVPLIVPTIASPVTFYYMKQYMDSTLPMALIEAARIDGSGEIRTFNTIALPLMKPAIAVQAIFSFVSSWNNYFVPTFILKKANLKTVPILIAQLRASDYSKFDMGQVYMMIALSIFPVVIVYLILSKHIVSGVALGSVKG